MSAIRQLNLWFAIEVLPIRLFNVFFVCFSAKLVPVGYGIKKLQIQCVVEDDKVGTDMLEERITAFEDYVQSMDVAAFNKI